MRATTILGLSAVLLLGGCLEAADEFGGTIRARTEYCHVPPDTVVLCPEKPPRQLIFQKRVDTGNADATVTK